MSVLLTTVIGEGTEVSAGKFGMTLDEASDAMLLKAKEMGLEGSARKNKKGTEIDLDFSPKKKGEKWPWRKLRDFADEWGVPYDGDGDPPWTYTVANDPQPDPGKYMTI